MPTGVPVTGTLRTYPSGQYPVQDAWTGLDGWRAVADWPTRDAIPNYLRRQGMAVVTQSDGNVWTLNAGPWNGTDTDWTLFGAVGQSGITLSGDASGTLSGGTIMVTVGSSEGNDFGTMAFQDASNVAITGGTITGVPTPINASDAVPKSYVDATTTGLVAKQSVLAASTANLNATYTNGSAGVGATLINAGTLAVFVLDGVSFTGSGTERVLVKNQAIPAQNGIYVVSTVGSGTIAWVLTRDVDFDETSEVAPGDYVVVGGGTVNVGTLWVETGLGPFTIGTTAITWTELTVAPILFTLTGDTTGTGATSITTTTVAVHGVTYPGSPGINTVPVVTAANTVTYEAVPNAALAFSAVTVVAGSGLAGGGSVSLGGSITLNLVAPVPVIYGGTGDASLAAYAILCGGTTATGALQQVSGLGVSGQVLTSNGAGTLPSWRAIVGTGTVTNIATGTGLTGGPITTTGTISMAQNNPNSLAGFDASGTFADVTVGSGLSLNAGVLTAGAAGGSVTQVNTGTGLAGGPITTAGTISIATGGVGTTQLAANAVTYAKLQNEAANTLLGNPTGSAAVPSEIAIGPAFTLAGAALNRVGGLVSVASQSARNAIPAVQRAEGMIAYINEAATALPGTYWQLLPSPWALTDADWSPAGPLVVDQGGTLVGQRGILNFVQGSGITLTLADNPTNQRVDVTIATSGGVGTGSVTSVGLSMPGVLYTVAGSPVTTSGVLTANLITQLANLVFAGPDGGAAATPTFRALTTDDIPELGVIDGGTGQTVLPAHAVLVGEGTDPINSVATGTAGQLLIDQGVGNDPAFVPMSGDATITAGGVVTVSGVGGTSFSLPLGVVQGGTGEVTLPAHAVLLGEGTSPIGFASVSTIGQVLIDQGATADPAFRPITGDGTLGPNGLLGITGLRGYPVATGAPTNGRLLIGSSTDQNWHPAGLTAGPNITITNGPGTITIGMAGTGIGTVTSVALAMPGVFAVTGSPVTGAGTLAVGLVAQSANLVWAGPSSGAAAVPTFRALTVADLPSGAGSVTSVALSMPGIFAVTGSPITTSGTLTAALNVQSANLIWAGPSSGAAAMPTFRALVAADFPPGTVNTLAGYDSGGNFGDVAVGSGLSLSGGTLSATLPALIPVTSGGTGLTSLTAHAVLIGAGTSVIGFATTGTAGQVLIDQGAASNPAFQPITGDLTLAASGAASVTAVHGVTYPASPATNTVPVVTATNTITYEQVPNTALANNSITISTINGLSGGSTVALGGTATLSLRIPVWASYGGTGLTSYTPYAPLCGGINSTAVLQQPASLGSVGQVFTSTGAGALPAFQSTGIRIDSHYGTITSDADGATILFNLTTSDWHIVTLGGNRTLALSNPTVGQQFTILLQQAASGGPYTPTWFAGISWMGPPYTAPTMPTTASGYLSATFKCISSGVYLGWWLGNSAS